MSRDIVDADGFAAATGASPSQMADMAAFRALLADWNEKMNLVGPSALAAFLTSPSGSREPRGSSHPSSCER